MQTHFLIIGQGLAGSILAWELIQRGCQVVVVDTGEENASRVAAGIVNPITGSRFVKSPELETLLPTAQACYARISSYFGQPFYLKKTILRVFRDKAEFMHCKSRLKQVDYAAYLGKLNLTGQINSGFLTPFGFVEQHQTGHLDTIPLLSHLKQFFISLNCYRQAKLDYQAIQITSAVHWQDIVAKQLIFCDGHHASQNPWFSWLPFQLAKGEILSLSHQADLPDAILNYGNWLLPISPGIARLGATFSWEFSDSLPSQQGRQSLLNSLKPYSPSLAQAAIISHQAEIRPCTLDKFPFIGTHPSEKKITIFNGFGTKGCQQIPWYSQRFADFLLSHLPMPKTCDAQRFQTTHFPG